MPVNRQRKAFKYHREIKRRTVPTSMMYALGRAEHVQKLVYNSYYAIDKLNAISIIKLPDVHPFLVDFPRGLLDLIN